MILIYTIPLTLVVKSLENLDNEAFFLIICFLMLDDIIIFFDQTTKSEF